MSGRHVTSLLPGSNSDITGETLVESLVEIWRSRRGEGYRVEEIDFFTLEDKRVSLGEGFINEDSIRGEQGGGAERRHEVGLADDVLIK